MRLSRIRSSRSPCGVRGRVPQVLEPDRPRRARRAGRAPTSDKTCTHQGQGPIADWHDTRVQNSLPDHSQLRVRRCGLWMPIGTATATTPSSRPVAQTTDLEEPCLAEPLHVGRSRVGAGPLPGRSPMHRATAPEQLGPKSVMARKPDPGTPSPTRRTLIRVREAPALVR